MNEKLDMLKAKPEIVNINGVDIKVKPLKLRDLDWLTRIDKGGEEQTKALKELAFIVLRDAFPETTDDELSEISLPVYNKLMEAIMKVNGLDTKKKEMTQDNGSQIITG